MSVSKKTWGIFILSLIVVAFIGYAIGSSTSRKVGPLLDIEKEQAKAADIVDENQQQQAMAATGQWAGKSNEELTASLSEIMLPEEEFSKLGDAIYQTAMGLLMAQAQNSGLEVTQATEQELKNSIEQKYNRQFFASQNASAMKDLSKDELVAILSFYNTPAGAKFLKLSPKIIESTMTTTQNDLQQWLPTTVENLVSKLKGNSEGGQPENQPPVQMMPPGGQPPYNQGDVNP